MLEGVIIAAAAEIQQWEHTGRSAPSLSDRSRLDWTKKAVSEQNKAVCMRVCKMGPGKTQTGEKQDMYINIVWHTLHARIYS